jgi:hypothetical protein
VGWVSKPNFLTSKFYGVISDSTLAVFPDVLISEMDFFPRKKVVRGVHVCHHFVGNN